jgi:hypothetical protein
LPAPLLALNQNGEAISVDRDLVDIEHGQLGRVTGLGVSNGGCEARHVD